MLLYKAYLLRYRTRTCVMMLANVRASTVANILVRYWLEQWLGTTECGPAKVRIALLERCVGMMPMDANGCQALLGDAGYEENF
jgi:hypothetical protein